MTLVVPVRSVVAQTVTDDCTVMGRLGEHCGPWKAEFDNNSGDDTAFAVDVSPDGSTVYVAGDSGNGSASGQSASDISVLAYDAETGDELWQTHHAGDKDTWDFAYDLAASPKGDLVFVTGTVDFDRFGTLGLDAETGEKLWFADHDPRPGARDVASTVEVSPDGSTVYITGRTLTFTPPWEIHVVAYDAATGDERWISVYDGPVQGRDLGSALVVSPDGSRVYVTGESEGDGTGQDLVAIAIDAATGERDWVFRYDGSGQEQPGITSFTSDTIGVSPDGSTVYFAGSTLDSDQWFDSGYRTLAVDAGTGELKWLASYDNGDSDFILPLAVSPDGSRVFVSGGSVGQTTTGVASTPVIQSESMDALTIAYDADTGEELWTARYQDATHGGERFNGDKMNALAVSPDGATVYATGQSHFRRAGPAVGSSDAVTIAYNAATGEQKWAAAYSSPRGTFDGAWDIAITPDGSRVFAAGWADATADSLTLQHNFLTLAYDAESKESTEVSFTEGTATSGQYTDETFFEARLADSDHNPIADANIIFELSTEKASRDFTATTGEDGIASVNPTLQEMPGPHQLTVRFAGDQEHAGDADSMSFVVAKEDTDLELSVHGEDDDKTLRARLSDLDTSSAGIAERAIDFYSDGEVIGSAVTDADGIASVALPPSHRGNNRTYEAVFEGDGFYLSSSHQRPGKGGKNEGGGGVLLM